MILNNKESTNGFESLTSVINAGLQNDYLATQKKFYNDTLYMELRDKFVQHWCESNLDGVIPDEDQVRAIASVEKNIQLIARAGSGKTATTVNRAIFLIQHCQIKPHEIMMLAFNKKAAKEIRERLFKTLYPDLREIYIKKVEELRSRHKQNLQVTIDNENEVITKLLKEKDLTLPLVLTFHALAYAISKPEENIISNQEKYESEELNEVIEQIIKNKMKEEDSAFFGNVKTIMLSYFKEDWENYEEGGLITDKSLYLKFRRNMLQKTLKGDIVKSYGEKIISNILFENNVLYDYERNWRDNDFNYKPDFTIPADAKEYSKDNISWGTKGIIIEYFGMRGIESYDEKSEYKRNFWKVHPTWKLIELYPEDIKDHRKLEKTIISHLVEYKINHKALTEDEIWGKIKDRAITEHTRTLSNFIGRCRKAQWSLQDLKDKVDQFGNDNKSFMYSLIFHQNCIWLYNEYLDALKRNNLEDFDGLLQAAINKLSLGTCSFQKYGISYHIQQIKHVFIDEFQDFSHLFNSLIQAIIKSSPDIKFFCVGDDWQAINGFAGADLIYFNEFSKYFRNSEQLYLKRNYRSMSAIVNAGNTLMDGLGEPAIAHQAIKGFVKTLNTDTFAATLTEQIIHKQDIITPLILRLINDQVKFCEDLVQYEKAIHNKDCPSYIPKIVLLSRNRLLPKHIQFQPTNRDVKSNKGTNSIEDYLKHIQSFFKPAIAEHISISTTHKYKGLEGDVVIVLDSDAYPLIHPHWMFTSIFGDTEDKIVEAERRLFYVALTRAKESAYVFSASSKEHSCPFLENFTTNITSIKNDIINDSVHNQYPKKLMIAISLVNPDDDKTNERLKQKLENAKFKNLSESLYWCKIVEADIDFKPNLNELERRIINSVQEYKVNFHFSSSYQYYECYHQEIHFDYSHKYPKKVFVILHLSKPEYGGSGIRIQEHMKDLKGAKFEYIKEYYCWIKMVDASEDFKPELSQFDKELIKKLKDYDMEIVKLDNENINRLRITDTVENVKIEIGKNAFKRTRKYKTPKDDSELPF